MNDLRFAFRSLAKNRGFTVVAIFTLAIAIGACSALFSVLQAVVLRPLPYPEPDRLVTLWTLNPERQLDSPTLSWAKYDAYRTRTDVFAALCMTAGNSFTLTDGTGDPEQVPGFHVTANLLPTLGLSPILGRQFTAEEDALGGPPVVMLGERLWRDRFGADPNILGRTVQIDGVARTVVGILPRRVPPPFAPCDILVPQAIDLPYLRAADRHRGIAHQAFARLAPGLTLAQAQARLNEMERQFRADQPAHIDAQNHSELRTLTQQVVGNLARTFWSLAGAVAAVLLIACANIANLFLARVSARTKEIAVRLSLGARRAEIVRQFITESLLFTTIAGVLGLFFAWWSLRGIQLLAGPQLPRADEIALDPVVVAFALGVALLAGVLIGLYPAIQASRTDVQVVLRETGRGAGGGRAAKSFRHALVVTQVALSLTLLICAGLLVSSFLRLLESDPGFRSAGRAFGGISLPNARYAEPERARDFAQRLQQKLAEEPELAHGAAVFGLPLTGTLSITPYAVHGRPIPPVQERPLVNLSFVTLDYFATLGIKLEAGRFFTADDRFEGEKVVILNASLARKLFPNGPALDQIILTGRDANVKLRVIGIISDVRVNGLTAPAPDQLYFSTAQRSANFLHVVAEARDGRPAATVIPVLRRVLRELDPALALAQPQTLDSALAESIGVQRVAMALLLAFAGIAAFLAAVGIYSVMAYAVVQRTGEIGVRIALGATPGDILRLVLRAGAVQVGTGILLGLFGAFAGSQVIRELLYQARAFDFPVFGGVVLAFSAVATAACLFPARRATRVDPMTALRAE